MKNLLAFAFLIITLTFSITSSIAANPAICEDQTKEVSEELFFVAEVAVSNCSIGDRYVGFWYTTVTKVPANMDINDLNKLVLNRFLEMNPQFAGYCEIGLNKVDLFSDLNSATKSMKADQVEKVSAGQKVHGWVFKN